MICNKYKKYISSALWSSGILYMFFILNFIGQIALARFLMPEDFGKIVLALAIVEVLKMFFGFSVSMAYIKAKDSATLFGSAIYLAFLGWLGMMFLSLILFYPLTHFYDLNTAIFVCIITFFSLFTYLAYVIEAEMEKNLHFKKSSFIVGISSVGGMAFAIVFAYYGFEEKSLIVREAIAPVILFIISTKYSLKKLTFKYDIIEVKEMFQYVYTMLFSRGAEVIYMKVPFILISTLFGSTTLGLISQMMYLAQLPNVALGPIATKISFVFYSHHNDDLENRDKGKNLLSILLLFLALPFSLVFYFYSTELLHILWGEKWIEGSRYLSQLAIFTLLLPVWNNLKSYTYSQNKNYFITQAYFLGSLVLFILIFFIPREFIGIAYSISIFTFTLWLILKIRGKNEQSY